MRAAIIGASGGIGKALVDALQGRADLDHLYAFSRTPIEVTAPNVSVGILDILDEDSLAAAVASIEGTLDLVFVATGVLSDGAGLQPERSYKKQTREAFEKVFAINTIGPALVAKHFLPVMPRQGRAVFAALSARVGSISDNQIGGWHAYRASKAALNMLIRNYAIEQARRNPDFIAVSLHPGTVDTPLSKPFQSGVPERQLFSPEQSVAYLLDVIDGLSPDQSGRAFDWAGKEIPA